MEIIKAQSLKWLEHTWQLSTGTKNKGNIGLGAGVKQQEERIQRTVDGLSTNRYCKFRSI